MITIRPSAIAIMIAAASALACSDSMACPTNPNLPVSPRAITLSVLDSITGRPIADSADGRLASGAALDSLWHDYYYPDSLLYGGWTAGTYAVSVVRPGYQPWLSLVVVSKSGSCGAYAPVEISARLQPAP